MKCSENTNENRMKTSRLLTSAQVAERLGLTVKAVYMKVYRNELPHVKFGTGNASLRFDEDEIQAWIDARRKGV